MAGVLLACVVAALAPPARAVAEPARSVPPDAASLVRELAVQSGDGTMDLYLTIPVGDLEGNGGRDLLAHDWKLRFADAGAGFDGVLTITAISGSTGRRLWRFERELTNTLPYPSAAARIGPGGDPGAIVFVDSHSPSYSLTAIGIDSEGTEVWEQSFASTYTPATSFTATGLPAGVYLVDALEGRATDLLVGIIDYADTLSRLKVALVDGADGSTTEPVPAETSAGAFPAVSAVGDLDADDRDDFVVVARGPADEGHATAYSGSSGTELWSQNDVDLGEPAMWAMGAGDVSGDGVREVLVSAPPNGASEAFHVLDGATGAALWGGEGTFPYDLGDVGDDGSVELGVTSGWQTEERTGEEFRAYRADGSPLYRRRYSTPLPVCDGAPCSVFRFLLDAGDLDGDDVNDLFVDLFIGGKRSHYLVGGSDGRKHLRGLGGIPLMATLDGRGDDMVKLRRLPRRRTRVSARDGRTGQTLWSKRLRGRVVGAQEPYQAAAPLRSARHSDVYATVRSKGRVSVVALSGRNGSVLWKRPL